MTASSKPCLMLIGDSIRMIYQPFVARMLAGQAEVVGPAENARFALYTLQRLSFWLEELPPSDVIHWNNGLWDVGHSTQRVPAQQPIDMYVGNLALILERLSTTGAQIIWATMTPIHPPSLRKEDGWSWKSEEIDRYNDAALELMRNNDVHINDLSRVIQSDIDRFLPPHDHHMNEAGAEACAKAVVASTYPYLFS